VSPAPGASVALSVQRGPDKAPFTDEELATVTRLGRHVEQALRIGARLLAAEARGLTTAGTSSAAELAGAFSAGRVGLTRALEKRGVSRDSDLASLLSRLAEA
jgi:hypothetical protein